MERVSTVDNAELWAWTPNITHPPTHPPRPPPPGVVVPACRPHTRTRIHAVGYRAHMPANTYLQDV